MQLTKKVWEKFSEKTPRNHAINNKISAGLRETNDLHYIFFNSRNAAHLKNGNRMKKRESEVSFLTVT